LRDLERKMTEQQKQTYRKDLDLYQRTVNQQKGDKNKVYSLHKAYTQFISKNR
jgi:IS5 family transposase